MILSRREMLAGAAGVMLPASGRKLKVAIFSKHLQFLRNEALAQAAAEMGFDGVDLAVRSGGHVEPERVPEELPPLVAALRRHGLEVPMITSGIVDAGTPHAETVLKTIASLGIRHYRWGGFRYDPKGPIAGQLEALKPRVAKLAALNARYNVSAMYHTHSGVGQIGAPIWDLHLLLKDFDPAAVGVNYDIAHATIEGGAGGWIASLRVTGRHLRGVAVKDFLWEKSPRGWQAKWTPLGEGMVRFPQFFQMLAEAGFSGPLQMHVEYPLGGAESGRTSISMAREEVFAAMKGDLRRLRGYLSEAGL